MRAFFLRGNIFDVRAVDFGTSTKVATLVVSGQDPSVLDVDSSASWRKNRALERSVADGWPLC
jgi:hypothetical protein